MENQIVIVDPYSNFPHGFDFSGIHYFRSPTFAQKDSYCWVIFTGEKISVREIGLFYDEDTDCTYEKEYFDESVQVKAMIELQQNPYDSSEIWLKFFEVAPQFKNQGISKIMIAELLKVLKDKYPSKTICRSSPSNEGIKYLKDNLTNAFISSGIQFKVSR